MKEKKFKLVYIEWDDARTIGDSWRRLDELIGTTGANPIRVKTIGWIVHEEKELVILAASLDQREKYIYICDGTVIPKTMIRKRKTIKLSTREK